VRRHFSAFFLIFAVFVLLSACAPKDSPITLTSAQTDVFRQISPAGVTAWDEGFYLFSAEEYSGFIDLSASIFTFYPRGAVTFSLSSQNGRLTPQREYIVRKENGLYGYIDQRGEWVIPPQWEEAWPFSDGLARVEKDQHTYYIDTDGNIAFESAWDDSTHFLNGLAPMCKDGKWGYMDRQGHAVIVPQWDETWASPSAPDIKIVSSNGKYGFIDSQGNVLCEPVYADCREAGEGFFRVQMGSKWGFVNSQGELVVPAEWEWEPKQSMETSLDILDSRAIAPDYFHDGYVVVERSGYSGVVDAKGTIILDPVWDRILPLSQQLFAAYSGGKYMILNTQGQALTSDLWNHVSPFFEGLAYAAADDKHGYIDAKGRMVISLSDTGYASGTGFSEGLAAVRLSETGKWGYINTRGKVVISPEWDTISPFCHGVALVEKDGAFLLIDKNGRILY